MLLGLQAVLPNGNINSTCRRFRDQAFGKLRGNDIPVVISERWKTTALADDDGNSLEGQPASVRIQAWRQTIERTIATLGLNRKYLLIGSQVQFSCIVGRGSSISDLCRPAVSMAYALICPPLARVQKMLR